jgi:hypothetical protein
MLSYRITPYPSRLVVLTLPGQTPATVKAAKPGAGAPCGPVCMLGEVYQLTLFLNGDVAERKGSIVLEVARLSGVRGGAPVELDLSASLLGCAPARQWTGSHVALSPPGDGAASKWTCQLLAHAAAQKSDDAGGLVYATYGPLVVRVTLRLSGFVTTCMTPALACALEEGAPLLRVRSGVAAASPADDDRITLLCEGKRFSVRRSKLVSAAPFWRQLVDGPMAPPAGAERAVTTVSAAMLAQIVAFVDDARTARVAASHSAAAELLMASHAFGMARLTEACVQGMTRTLSARNAGEALALAQFLDLQPLELAVYAFLEEEDRNARRALLSRSLLHAVTTLARELLIEAGVVLVAMLAVTAVCGFVMRAKLAFGVSCIAGFLVFAFRMTSPP